MVCPYSISFSKDSTFYISKDGIFFEGQILQSVYQNYLVIIDKFIVHYNNEKKPELYVRCKNFDNKQKFTMSVDSIGVYYIAYKF